MCSNSNVKCSLKFGLFFAFLIELYFKMEEVSISLK